MKTEKVNQICGLLLCFLILGISHWWLVVGVVVAVIVLSRQAVSLARNATDDL